MNMNSFANAARTAAHFTRTENGAKALNTTGNALLDFYSTVGALREADQVRVERLFNCAYDEDPLFATKILFYARDIREGLGERQTFRNLIKYMAINMPNALRPNLDLIGVFGRYDDLYSLIGTPLENDMWNTMKTQLKEDEKNLEEGNAVSLLGKWLKTADASSERTRKLGILTAKKLGMSVYDYKRLVRKLRKQIGIVEALMSAGKWDEIKYSNVPSRAMMIYRNAYKKHDYDRFTNFISRAKNGEVTIHSETLYPYDLIERIVEFNWGLYDIKDDDVVEAQWRQLPNYVNRESNIIVIADTSGSMQGRPMATSVGLAVYFAERNFGAFHNLWMTFSSRPKYQELKGVTLAQKLSALDTDGWNNNTNLEAALRLVLDTATRNHIPQEEIPKALIIISDMEIDACSRDDADFYSIMRDEYAKNGYEIPNIIFWNVNSRHDVFHADSKRLGVQLVSGSSASTFMNVIDCLNMTPVEAMEKTINSERYACIRVDEA